MYSGSGDRPLDEHFCNNSHSQPLPTHLKWIYSEAPGFSLSGSQVKVLYTPDDFYSSLVEGCSRAEHRIAFSALYVGTGTLEQKLVEVLDSRMTECNKALSVVILLDALRGARDQSVHTMLLPLIKKHSNCQVSLYHTPVLRGLARHLLPGKCNEVIGLQHIKLYVFDNDIIITGANLTTDYFTTRQDRYMWISKCQPLADFCHGLIEQICSLSLQLRPDGSLEPDKPHLHPYLSPSKQFLKHAHDTVWGYYQQAVKKSRITTPSPGADTWIFPVLQLPPFNVFQDSEVTQAVLESVHPKACVHFTSPYFNLPEAYITSLLHKCKASFNILIPHPTASDFFGAKGFSGNIPSLYTVTASSFSCHIQSSGNSERFTMAEFVQPDTSYHCKGIWVTEPNNDNPYLTITGSSNFNCRSVKRDLECQMVVVTSNKHLRTQWGEEHRRLYKQGVPFTQEVVLHPNRKPKLWHHLFLWLFKSYF